jgi:hypothetical protein
LEVIAAIEFQRSVAVRPVVATESSILSAIEKHYLRQGNDASDKYRLHGWAAIEFAEGFGGSLHAYCWDPREASRPLELGDAKRVARKHPWWVYLDVALCERCLAEGELRRAGRLRPDTELSLCDECGTATP